MKRSLLILIALLAAVGAIPGSALASATGTTYPLIVINNGSWNQYDIHVSGRYATYTDDATGASAVKYFDFQTQATGSVPPGAAAEDALPDVDAGTILFTRAISPSSVRIYSYPIGGTPTEVAPTSPRYQQNAAIGGSTIVWEDRGISGSSNPQLVADANGSITQLTSDTAANKNPNVSPDGSTVAWEKCSAPGSCDIYAAVKTGTSWSVSPVATTAANESSPDTNGAVVVYMSGPAGGSTIHVHSLVNGTDQTVALPSGATWAAHPAISANFVAFEAWDGASTDLWVYDTADGTLRRITNTPGSELLSDISASTAGGTTTVRLVWQVNEGDDNVYASEFQVSSQPPFTDQFLQPLVQSTDPASPVINTGKNGRVIPVKVQISQGTTQITDQNTPGPVTIAVSKLASCGTSAGSDPIATYADAGQSSAGTNQFHFDAGAQAWLYNLDTKALGLITGNCYRIDVAVNGSQVTNAFAVFQPTK